MKVGGTCGRDYLGDLADAQVKEVLCQSTLLQLELHLVLLRFVPLHNC